MDSFTPESLALYTEILVCVGLVYGVYWVATTPRESVQTVALVVVLWFLLSEGAESALAQTTQTGTQPIAPGTTIPGTSITAPQTFPTVLKNGVQLPDWSRISFSSMDPFSEAGSVTIPSEFASTVGFDKVAWQAGQKIADALPLGAMSGCLGMENMTQKQIDGITGQVSSGVGLDQFMPAGLQSIKSLANAVPDLQNQLVQNVKPIADLVSKAMGGQLPGLDVSSLQGLVSQAPGASSARQVLDNAGALVGSVSNGQFLDAAGTVVGQVFPSGQVLDAEGTVLGTVDGTGQFVNVAGQVVGKLGNPVAAATQAATQAGSQAVGQVTQQAGGYTGLAQLNPQQLTIGQLTQQFPQLSELGLKNLDLSQYTMGQIPNLYLAKLSDFASWEKVLLKGIPGLDKVPFSQFPNALTEGPDPYIARIDVPLDGEEQDRERSLSGSYKQGFRVPCTKDCEHAELSPIAGSQMDAARTGAFANGKSWMSKRQLVEGGQGALAVVNGGKEPTGRHPYCSVFKQVITKVDQPAGKVGTSLYFRICKHGLPDLGCTPYFIGPIPFLTYAEKQFIYLGDGNAKDDGGGIDVGGQNDPMSSQDGFNDCGSKLSGDAVNKATSAIDRVAKGINDPSMQISSQSAVAKDTVARIMAEAKAQGITCPAQIANMLATAGRESSMGANMGESADTASQSSGGTQYWGRGYVQITGQENYAKGTAYLKSQGMNVDLVANPDLAKQPAIAAKLLVYGMKTGMFTTQKVGDYVNCNGRVDFSGARNVVNPGEGGTNRANIAKASQIYYDALKDTNVADGQTQDNCGGATSNQGGKDGWYDPLPGGNQTHPYGEYPHGSPPHVHKGIDIQKTQGRVPIFAARAGVVTDVYTGCPDHIESDGAYLTSDSSCGGGYGNYVVLKHDNGYETLYGHNHRPTVHMGQPVKGGEQIAEQGSTGASFGAHTHFEVIRGSQVSPRSVGVPNMRS